MASEDEIPKALIDTILRGECVAFVGAGFSAPAGLPGWKDLLRNVLDLGKKRLGDAPELDYVERRLEEGGSHAYDEAAQILEDLLGEEMLHLVAQRLKGPAENGKTMQQRRAWLYGIPFRSILTTNFDAILKGETPAPKAYGTHLRAEAPIWSSGRFWGGEALPPPTLKLHGDVKTPESIVLSRRGYRRNLYRDPGYQAFLRALFAQQTILFLGFSFSDAYLNELRSESLTLFAYDQGMRPIAYALVNDAPEAMRRHYLQNEGIHLISFPTAVPGQDSPDFSGFDRLLEKLHTDTNPIRRFADALQGKRILWIDKHPDNNSHERRFMEECSSRDERPGATFVEERDLEAARPRFERGERFDLVITHWGSDYSPPMAAQVLRHVRSLDKDGCPVIVFGAGLPEADVAKRRDIALNLGAQDYLHDSEELLQKIDSVLSGGMDRRTPAGLRR